MAKVKDNIVTKGLSGSIGDIVTKLYGDETVITKKPARSKFPPTKRQERQRDLFKAGAAYAEEAIKDAALVATIKIEGLQSVKNVLIQQYMDEHKNDIPATPASGKYTPAELRDLGCNERQIKAVKHLQSKKELTNAIYRKINNTSKPTATRDLQSLLDKQIIRSSGIKGPGACYILTKA